MHCGDVAQLLLAPEDDGAQDAGVAAHVSGCDRCTAVGRRIRRLDSIVAAALVTAPPLELQQRLVALAWGAAGESVTMRRSPLGRATSWLARPHQALAQGLAAICVLLAGWQLFAWLNLAIPVLGDVPYALQLVASSLAAVSDLGGMSLDTQGLAAWSLVAVAGWMVSENGPLHRWLFGSRPPAG